MYIDSQIQQRIWDKLKTGSVGFIFAMILVIVYFWKCEQINRNFLVPVWKFLYRYFGIFKKKRISSEIEGNINFYVKQLNKKLIDYQVDGIKIKWVSGAKKEFILQQNNAIIRMRKEENQNANLVNAVNILVEHSLLYKSKRYLDKAQYRSIELYTAKKICERQNAGAIQYFHNQYFEPALRQIPDIQSHFDIFSKIDKQGLYINLFLQEILFLGEKIYFSTQDKKAIADEIDKLIKFLDEFSERKAGERELDKNFIGANINFGIVLIANIDKREKQDIMPYLRYISSLVNRGTQDIYLLARGENIPFLKEIKNHIASIAKNLVFKHEDTTLMISVNNLGEVDKCDVCTILLRNKNISNILGSQSHTKVEDLRVK